MVDDNTRRQNDSNAWRLIEAGSNLAGATSGAALGIILGAGTGEAVPIAVAGAGVALASMLREIGERLLDTANKFV